MAYEVTGAFRNIPVKVPQHCCQKTFYSQTFSSDSLSQEGFKPDMQMCARPLDSAFPQSHIRYATYVTPIALLCLTSSYAGTK